MVHTTGPWTRGEENESQCAVWADGKHIATVKRGLIVGRAEADANLLLIQAAPYMLSILKSVADGADADEIRELARTAVAVATGNF